MIEETKGKVALARYTDPDGKVSVVQIRAPWQKLEDGASYYSSTHDGHLKCICCETSVKMVSASVSSGGSSGAGMPAYFRTVGKHDENCIVPTRHRPGGHAQKIDRSKGFRIHINTSEFSQAFHQATGAYEISPKGRITITDPDLCDREVYTVKNASDLVKFIASVDPKRLNDSLIIFRNLSWTWQEVCIRYGKESRYSDVVERARGAVAARLPFVLMEIQVPQGVGISEFNRPITTIESPRIAHGTDDRGLNRWIYPTVKINNRQTYGLFHDFGQAGSFFVMGQMRVDTWQGDFITKDSAIVYVEDRRQVARVNIENLGERVTANAERSIAKAARADLVTDFKHS